MNCRLVPFFALREISARACEGRKKAYVKNMPIPRWSLRFSPTPGSSKTTLMPTFSSSSRGPTPETLRTCPFSSAVDLTTETERNVRGENRWSLR